MFAAVQRPQFDHQRTSFGRTPAGPADGPGIITCAKNSKPEEDEDVTMEDANQPTETHPQSEAPCLCNRPPGIVACRRCGDEFFLAGRKRERCPRHPNLIELMDHDHCRECRSTNLIELPSP